MLHWLVGLWQRLERWVRGEKPAPQIYRRSNLHGRFR